MLPSRLSRSATVTPSVGGELDPIDRVLGRWVPARVGAIADGSPVFIRIGSSVGRNHPDSTATSGDCRGYVQTRNRRSSPSPALASEPGIQALPGIRKRKAFVRSA